MRPHSSSCRPAWGSSVEYRQRKIYTAQTKAVRYGLRGFLYLVCSRRKTEATMDNDNIHSAYRGDIFYADLEPVRGSEQGGVRPVLIIQNDIGNRHSPTVIVAAITSRIKHHRLPTHVNLNGRQCGLHNESTIMLEQLRTLDKQRLLGYAGTVGKSKMREVNTALEISIGIKDLLLDNKRKRGSNYGKSEHREEKHQGDPDDH